MSNKRLIDVLEKDVRSKTSNEESIVDSARLLLSANEAEERKVLEAIGLDNEIKYYEEKNSKIRVHKEYSKKYNTLIVSKHDLINFCKKYALVVGSPKEYTGKIPTDAGVKLNAFCKNNHIVLGGRFDFNTAFKVIAPKQLFIDKNTNFSKEFLMGLNEARKESIEAFKRAMDPDPMLIYRIDSDFYAIIHTWGSDDTLTRRMLGIYYQYIYPVLTALTVYLIIPALFWFVSVKSFLFFDQFAVKNSFWYIILNVVASIYAISSIIINVFYYKDFKMKYIKRNNPTNWENVDRLLS